ncbi:FadR family transcriptional regulator [Verticiella sediminum]|uniref:FadR family transcriptional regulator n=1 Tax=Verticiella sediminum TaxID=1247510 RepID=A0A556AJL6_9BURK|nr:FCD domain-containing protein [Verticiella sediminum]TSH93069.1 FadR family transcriptional regulator [Verticiella sediminum]
MEDHSSPDSPLEFVPIVPQRAFEDIAGQIRGLIASGRLKPGDRLPAERKLSAQFNVSRNTMREALRALELSGLVELRKGAAGGAFVLPGSPDVIVNGLMNLYHLGAISPAQLTEARIWLTAVVVRVACERVTEEDLAALEANIAAATAARDAGDFERRARLQVEFHVRLAETTRNPVLHATMMGVSEVLQEFIRGIGPSDNPYVLPSRRRFMQHLRKRDADAAVAEMTKLLERLRVSYLSQWEAKQRA